MNYFLDCLNRLKHYLRVSNDAEVAAALGISKTAFAERKRRGSFPDDKLFALAAKRPELKIDVNYVLKGETATETATKWIAVFPARLREVRATRSPAAFAKLMNLSLTELEELEAGSRLPTQEFVMRLAEKHPDRSVAWLFGGEAPTVDGELSDLEAILIKNYRSASEEGRHLMRHQAACLADYNMTRSK